MCPRIHRQLLFTQEMLLPVVIILLAPCNVAEVFFAPTFTKASAGGSSNGLCVCVWGGEGVMMMHTHTHTHTQVMVCSVSGAVEEFLVAGINNFPSK
jgi:hypothetical protein